MIYRASFLSLYGKKPESVSQKDLLFSSTNVKKPSDDDDSSSKSSSVGKCFRRSSLCVATAAAFVIIPLLFCYIVFESFDDCHDKVLTRLNESSSFFGNRSAVQRGEFWKGRSIRMNTGDIAEPLMNVTVILMHKIPSSAANLRETIGTLARINGFQHRDLGPFKPVEQMEFVENLTNQFVEEPSLMALEHARPFTDVDWPFSPHVIHMKFIEEPATAFFQDGENGNSDLYEDSKEYKNIPYFCGQDPDCQVPESNWALRKAKANLEKRFPVVPVTSHLADSLEVMERQLPHFFDGAVKVYKELSKNLTRTFSESPVVPSALKRIQGREMEFYNFAKDLLHKQLEQLRQSPK